MRRITGSVSILAGVLSLLMWTAVSAQQAKSPYLKASGAAFGNANAITQDELKTYEYFLSADALQGRNLPSPSYDAAALYIASHLKEWNLVPGGTATPAEGPLQPYLIPFELVSTQPDAPNMKLSVTLPPRPRRGPGAAEEGSAAKAAPQGFEYGKDWTAGTGGFRGPGLSAAEFSGAKFVFVGNGYVINKTKTNPYQGIDVRGKVMIVAGLPPDLAAAGGRAGRGAPNPLGVENTDFVTPQAYAAKNGAAGILLIPNFQQLAAMVSPPPARPELNGPRYQVAKFMALQPASVPTITAGIELINRLFQGEKLSGAQVFAAASANTPAASFDLSPIKTAALTIAVTTTRNHAYNVMAVLEGRDPALKHEYVVMSAHLDHIGLSAPDAHGDAIDNGADDDASGCTALLGIAHAYATGAARGIRPRRSMIFLWMAGEEKGLWGSQYFNEFPPVDITKVVADLNMDMIGRSKTPGYVDPPSYKLAEPNEVFIVGPRVASGEMGQILEKVNASYLKLKLNDFYDTTAPDRSHDNIGPGESGQRIFYRSDHYNFVKMGIPIVFFSDGLHADYHRVTDSAEKIDYDKVEAVAKTIYAVAWTLGNSPTRPKLDAKLPERLVDDMKTVKAQGWGRKGPGL